MKQAIAKLYKKMSGKDMVFFDYALNPASRYSEPHKELNNLLRQGDAGYKARLEHFLAYQDVFLKLQDAAIDKITETEAPYYNNGFLPGLDIVSLYGMVSDIRPKVYYEIGSGNSTKVARLAVDNGSLDTRIVSLDPMPRAEINKLSHEIIRKPLQSFTDFSFIIDELNENDILFYDGTHLATPDSDVVAFFLDILPKLKKGVIVHIHDIYLPYDYPQFMCDRYYSEQYLLAAFLLADPRRYRTILPCYYIFENKHLLRTLDPIFGQAKFDKVEKHGGSYWLRIEG